MKKWLIFSIVYPLVYVLIFLIGFHEHISFTFINPLELLLMGVITFPLLPLIWMTYIPNEKLKRWLKLLYKVMLSLMYFIMALPFIVFPLLLVIGGEETIYEYQLPDHRVFRLFTPYDNKFDPILVTKLFPGIEKIESPPKNVLTCDEDGNPIHFVIKGVTYQILKKDVHWTNPIETEKERVRIFNKENQRSRGIIPYAPDPPRKFSAPAASPREPTIHSVK